MSVVFPKMGRGFNWHHSNNNICFWFATGISGFVKRMSLQLFSVRLQSAVLPSKGKYQLSKFVMVIQKNKVIFLEANMLGDFYEGSMSKY